MKRKLILFAALVLMLPAAGQGSLKQRAAARRAGLQGHPAAMAQAVPAATANTAALSPAPQRAAQSRTGSPSPSSAIQLSWVEFLTPQTASVSELYNVATGFARGSYEFCEILDLSGRLFPTDPTACINAAGVALLRGNATTARRYLQNLMTDSRAFNNIGLLFLLEGNRDKAEVYLQLAAANGTSPGAAALK